MNDKIFMLTVKIYPLPVNVGDILYSQINDFIDRDTLSLSPIRLIEMTVSNNHPFAIWEFQTLFTDFCDAKQIYL